MSCELPEGKWGCEEGEIFAKKAVWCCGKGREAVRGGGRIEREREGERRRNKEGKEVDIWERKEIMRILKAIMRGRGSMRGKKEGKEVNMRERKEIVRFFKAVKRREEGREWEKKWWGIFKAVKRKREECEDKERGEGGRGNMRW